MDISSVDLEIIQSSGAAQELSPAAIHRHDVLPPIPSVHWLVLMAIRNVASKNSFWAEFRKVTAFVNDTASCYRIYNIDGRAVFIANHYLRKYQKWVLDNILAAAPVSEFATAYTKGRSVKDNARPHTAHRTVVKTDIRHFFDSITYRQVYRVFERITPYPVPVLIFLSKLCCLNGHLPQGVSTSPYLSNLCMQDIDNEIGRYCREKGIAYTRYSDDMTFSADDFDTDALLGFVEGLLCKHGFRLNKRKTRILRSGVSHNVTGVVCNEKTSVPAEYKRKIRQEMHYIEKFGLREHLKRTDEAEAGSSAEIRYLYRLIGRINYVLSIETGSSAMLTYRDTASRLLDDLLHQCNDPFALPFDE